MIFLYFLISPGTPLILVTPPVCACLPMRTLTNVDLPAPEAPMTPQSEPRSILPVTSDNIGLLAFFGWNLRSENSNESPNFSVPIHFDIDWMNRSISDISSLSTVVSTGVKFPPNPVSGL